MPAAEILTQDAGCPPSLWWYRHSGSFTDLPRRRQLCSFYCWLFIFTISVGCLFGHACITPDSSTWWRQPRTCRLSPIWRFSFSRSAGIICGMGPSGDDPMLMQQPYLSHWFFLFAMLYFIILGWSLTSDVPSHRITTARHSSSCASSGRRHPGSLMSHLRAFDWLMSLRMSGIDCGAPGVPPAVRCHSS